ncbi:uncharacterized protein LOC129589625 [Paramacrobiotus metropolitanus]|uniref:uncharacterized protein LOC129589625 n=1 Tax=Paramacrobiotus metropolitanus TaxID=2943436 RepID=UPI0024457B93|nr:uncharacterized protein LOC129589625 [Paramacrobiotus metropolitanus]
MDNLLQHLGKFRSVPAVVGVCLLLILLSAPTRSENHNIKIINKIENPLSSDTKTFGNISNLQLDETLEATLSFCPNVSLFQMINLSQSHDNEELSYGSINYNVSRNLWEQYMKIRHLRGDKGIMFNLRMDSEMQDFGQFLELKPYVGVYLVTLELTNLTVTEIQDALTFAWAPSFESSNWTATHVEILQIQNGSDDITYYSASGSPLTQILYMVPISDSVIPMNLSSDFSHYPWRFARNSSYHELPKIITPSITDFVQRLRSKGLIAHQGPVFHGTVNSGRGDFYLSTNSTSGSFNTDRLKADLLELVQQERIKQGCGGADMSDVQINFSPFVPRIAPMRKNGTFSEIKVLPLNFQLMIQKKAHVHGGINLVPLSNHTDRYYARLRVPGDEDFIPSYVRHLEDRPMDPVYSFRMYLSPSMNVQLLPELESLMRARLNKDLRHDQYASVRLWNFDPDGWVVSFFVTIYKLGWRLDLDGRLPYAKSIYRKLDGLQLTSTATKAVYTLTNVPLPSLFKETMKTLTMQDLEAEQDVYLTEGSSAPLKKTFTLYVQSALPWRSRIHPLVNGWKANLLNSDRILEAVQQAFAEANPVTIDDITLTITLTERDNGLRTVTDDEEVSKFYFALSYPKMKYWRMWRYPTVDQLNKFLISVAKARVVESWTMPLSNTASN